MRRQEDRKRDSDDRYRLYVYFSHDRTERLWVFPFGLIDTARWKAQAVLNEPHRYEQGDCAYRERQAQRLASLQRIEGHPNGTATLRFFDGRFEHFPTLAQALEYARRFDGTTRTEVLQRFGSSVKIPLPPKPALPKWLKIKGPSFWRDCAGGSFSAKSEKLQHFPRDTDGALHGGNFAPGPADLPASRRPPA